MADQNEWKEIVREILHQGSIDLSKAQTVNKDSMEVRITPLGEGSTRFDLPRPQKTYIIMSGRLYERPYMSDGNVHASDSKSTAAEKSIPNATQSHFAIQPSYTGEEEQVDTRIYCNRITCACGNPRWLKSSDLAQSKGLCKPCIKKGRQARRKAKQ